MPLTSFSYEESDTATARLLLLSSPEERKPWCFLARLGETYIGQADTVNSLYSYLRTLGRMSYEPERFIAIPNQSGICDYYQSRIERRSDGRYFIHPGGQNYHPATPTYINGKKLLNDEILIHGSQITFEKPNSPPITLLFLDPTVINTTKLISPDTNMATFLLKQYHWLDAAIIFHAAHRYEDAARAFESAAQKKMSPDDKYLLLMHAADAWAGQKDAENHNKCLINALECKGGPSLDLELITVDLQINYHGSVDILLRNGNYGGEKGWDAEDIDVEIRSLALKSIPQKSPSKNFSLGFGEEKHIHFSSLIFAESVGEIFILISFRTDYDRNRRFSLAFRKPVILREGSSLPTPIAKATMNNEADAVSIRSSINLPAPGVDFVLITALPEELDAVLNKLPQHVKHPPERDSIHTYYQTDLPVVFPDKSTGSYRVIIICLLGMGRLQAGIATIDAIHKWHPRYIVLIGIAGGIAAKNLHIGDILISNQVVDYELQKLTPEGPEIRWEVHRADARLLDAWNNFRNEGWQQLIDIERPGRGKPNIHVGPIVSGDKVIAFSDVLVKYRDMWPKLVGVEMEASGVATAAFQSPDKPGFFMVRGVSDLADKNKSSSKVKKWRIYACDVAASITIALLSSGPIPLVEHGTRNALDNLTKRLLNEADDFFFSGQFKEARALYFRVLANYPDYPSAVERLMECLEIIQGKKPVPLAQLPKDAGHLLGQARSAARVGRYNEAKVKLEEAIRLVEATGIVNWGEGAKFYEEIVNTQNAELLYRDAMELAREGKWVEALDKLQRLGTFGDPKYNEAIIFINEVLRINGRLSPQKSTLEIVVAFESTMALLDNIQIPFGWHQTRDQARQSIVQQLIQRRRSILKEVEDAINKIASGEFVERDHALAQVDAFIHVLQVYRDVDTEDQMVERRLERLKNIRKGFIKPK